MDITIKLTFEQWNAVLDLLSDGTVRKALPLINAIVAQAKEQMPPQEHGLDVAVNHNGAVLE